MKYLEALTFAFLILAKGTVSALQALSLPPNPAPSDPPIIDTVPDWTYRGCWTDNVNSRTLTGISWTGNITPRRCANVCSGFRYFALESSNECYCGNTMAHSSILKPGYFCENVCSGNQQSICGGHSVLTLYEANKYGSTAPPLALLISSNSTTNSSDLAPPQPSKPPGPPKAVVVNVPGWTYRGCWTDKPQHRTLTAKFWKGYVTPQRCAEICKGYHYFGLEYSNECYCGNTISPGTRRAPENVCKVCCMGNFGIICGGSNAMSLYEADDNMEAAVL